MAPAANAADAGPKPTITLSSSTLTPGQSVIVEGAHWPQGATFQALLCGNGGVDGSANCVPDTAVIATPGPDGGFTEPLQVTMPPVPCPCVLLVTRLDSNMQERIPVQVVGAPVAPVERHQAPKLRDTITASAKVDSSTTLASIFGGAADRTVVLTLHNSANVPVRRALVVSFWGKDKANHPIPTRFVTVPPRGSVTLHMPFQLDPLSIGG